MVKEKPIGLWARADYNAFKGFGRPAIYVFVVSAMLAYICYAELGKQGSVVRFLVVNKFVRSCDGVLMLGWHDVGYFDGTFHCKKPVFGGEH